MLVKDGEMTGGDSTGAIGFVNVDGGEMVEYAVKAQDR